PICGANYVRPRVQRPAKPAPVVITQRPPEAPPVAAIARPLQTPAIPPSRVSNVSETPKAPPGSALAQALHLTQEGLTVFQRMQEQTAQLHKQFLQSQDTAQQTLQRLIEQQQQLLLASIGAAPVQPISVIPAPAPQPVPLQPAPVAIQSQPARILAP